MLTPPGTPALRSPFTRQEQPNHGLLAPLGILTDLLKTHVFQAEELPLAGFAQTFRHYVNFHGPPDVMDIADFAVITSQLALIKSRTLLPALPYEEEGEFVDAEVNHEASLGPYLPAVDDLYLRMIHGRETFTRADHIRPPTQTPTFIAIPAQRLSAAFTLQVQELLHRHAARVAPPTFLRVEVAARSLRRSLSRVAMVSLIRLIRRSRLGRREVVVYFLAMLEMARDGHIGVRQEEPFADIVLERRTPPPGRAESSLT